MFQYVDAILVCPIVEHSANEEGSHALRVIIIMPRRLLVKEVVAIQKRLNLGFPRGQIRVHRACYSSSTVANT
jgi:hypothetical protein